MTPDSTVVDLNAQVLDGMYSELLRIELEPEYCLEIGERNSS